MSSCSKNLNLKTGTVEDSTYNPLFSNNPVFNLREQMEEVLKKMKENIRLYDVREQFREYLVKQNHEKEMDYKNQIERLKWENSCLKDMIHSLSPGHSIIVLKEEEERDHSLSTSSSPSV